MTNIRAIVLAAGKGTRMISEMPKVLHKVGSKTMVERVISSLKKSGINKITVVVGYKADEIKKVLGDSVDYAIQRELLGSGDGVKSALKSITDNNEHYLVTCGDAPLIGAEDFEHLVSKHIGGSAELTLLTAIVDDPFAYGRIVRCADEKVIAIIEEKDASEKEKAIKEINVGTYCFKKDILEASVAKIKKNDAKGEYYLTDVVGFIAEEKGTILSFIADPISIIGINSRKDLARVNKLMNMKKIDELMASGVTVVDPATTYVDDDAVILKDTVIYPSTVIEGNVKVGENCKIGPFARLRLGTELAEGVEVGNFVEVCRTKIGKDTKVKHHTYLGDSVIGKNVNIGAGVITANYDGKNKNRTIVEDGAFLGVGARLIAPVTIGANATVGAGSVVTKGKNVKPGTTVVGIPAKEFMT